MRLICFIKKCSHQFSCSFPKFCLELNFLQGVILRKNITGHLKKDRDVSSWPQHWAHASALGSCAWQTAGCARSSASEHKRVSFGRDFFFCLYLQRYHIVQDSNMLRAIAFLGAKKRERQKKAHFLWQTFLQGFASLASFTWAFIPVYLVWHECLALIWGQTAP